MHFIKIFFTTTVLTAALLLGLVYAVDPYDKYGINVFGFETKAVAMARENKFMMVEHAQKDYGAFVIGSSAAHRLQTEDVEKVFNLPTFNYAVQHTTPEDYLAVTRHILAKAKPKVILFQMDFYGLNENFKTDTRFYTSPLKAYLDGTQKTATHSWIDQDYLTLGAVADSFKVIWVNNFGKVRHLYLADGNYQKEKPYEGPVEVTQFSYENYTISKNRVELLREMKKLCDEANVQLFVWSAPYSYQHMKLIMDDPKLAKSLVDFKATLVEIFGSIHDFSNLDVKPFNNWKYFRDSSHPTQELFRIMLSIISGQKKPQAKFGEILHL